MRCLPERCFGRGGVTLILLMVPLCYFLLTFTTSIRTARREPFTIVLSDAELRALLAAKNMTPTPPTSDPSHKSNPPPVSDPYLVSNPSPKVHDPNELDFVVIKNKVYMKSEVEGNLKKKIQLPSKVQWPIALELSEAADLYKIDFSNFESEEREFLEARREVMVERARLIKRVCQDYTNDKPGNSHLVFDQKHTPNIVWCPNYKVASTTWMVNFMKLAHFNDDNPAIPDLPEAEKNILKYLPRYGARHGVVYKLYPIPETAQERVDVLKRSVRFIVVRHPFTRVLSAYRDKMIKEHPLPPQFKFGELQKKIIAKYRPKGSNITSPFPTFPEFVQHIIDYTKDFTKAKEWKKKVRCWTAYWAQCGVCTTDYNIIMKLETLPQDEHFLVSLASLTELKKSEGEWRHLRNVSSTTAAPEYYRQLTQRQIMGLHHSYKKDFDLFGYTVDEYLPLARDAHEYKKYPPTTG